MEIPYQELAKDTLIAIIEDFVTREGTDYGHSDFSLEQKVQHVLNQLEVGEAKITFDGDSESCSVERVK